MFNFRLAGIGWLSILTDLEASVTATSLPQTTPRAGADPPPGLAGLEDSGLLRLIHGEPAASRARAAACEVLVARYELLVSSCARRYHGTPESVDELMQVGYVGLMKAINRFDPDIGASLAPYALACVSGEIKRHFRDRRWQVRVKRSAQEMVLRLRQAAGELAQQLQRTPTEAELARYLQVTVAEVRAARSADLGFSAWSLDAPLSEDAEAGSLAELIGAEDPQMEHAVDMAALSAHWDELPRRQQRMLLLRFYGEMTQAEIGEQLGLSQMHVSRLISQSLRFLRERMLGDPPDGAGQEAGTRRARAS